MAVLAFSKVKDGRIGEGIVIGWGGGLVSIMSATWKGAILLGN